MIHSFKTSGRQIMQCKCRWCGCYGNRGTCVSDDVKGAVAKFAAEHGRTWKAALRELWLQGKDEGLLRQARNSIGPRQLDKITPLMLRRAMPLNPEGGAK